MAYRVEIKTDVEKTVGTTTTIERGVHDLAGNPLDNAFMWTFRTKDAPFEQVWSIGLSMTDGISLDGNNMAGVEYGASDGTDEKDAPSVPAMAGQMRLSYLDRQRQEFDRNIRPADGRLSHHWFFVIDNVEKYATVTLSWQPSLLLTKTTRQYQVMRLVEFDSQGNVTNNISLDPTQVNTNQQTGDPELTEIYSYVNKGELTRYFRLDVQKENFVAKSFKKGSSGWKFFSAPVTPQRAEPFVNLGDDIDPFKLYEYKTKLGGYKIYPFDIGEVSLQTRYGYWTRLEKDIEVDVGGASNFNDMLLELNTAGWQAIGNPFILPVNVADLEVKEGTSTVLFDEAVADGLIEGTLYRWDIVTKDEAYMSEAPISDSYAAVTNSSKLEPWEGYWLKTKKPDITLVIPAPQGIGTATVETPAYLKLPRAPRLNSPLSQRSLPQFTLCAEVFLDGASDRSTILGTNQEAMFGQDAFDSTEPPVMGQTVAGYFEHSNWGEAAGSYNQDYQPAMNIGEQRTWQLTVYTDKPNAPMTIFWEKSIRQVPSDIMLSFREVGKTTWQDMRQMSKVEFISDSRITERKFEIKAERIERAIPLSGETRLLPCYPNPFQTGVWMPYELSEDSAVEIRIYNIAGELVRELDLGMKPAGSYVDSSKAAYWDGCNQSGERVASGIYLYIFKAGNFMAVKKMGICR
ncbi:T9SS type A sorting domain-containing protein [bacterium]|nr:T9SS type A sorting domain-containing protein [bacterium]MBU1752429.1 T9SS type A sorting domain-containing protein [bacterium]